MCQLPDPDPNTQLRCVVSLGHEHVSRLFVSALAKCLRIAADSSIPSAGSVNRQGFASGVEEGWGTRIRT